MAIKNCRKCFKPYYVTNNQSVCFECREKEVKDYELAVQHVVQMSRTIDVESLARNLGTPKLVMDALLTYMLGEIPKNGFPAWFNNGQCCLCSNWLQGDCPAMKEPLCLECIQTMVLVMEHVKQGTGFPTRPVFGKGFVSLLDYSDEAPPEEDSSGEDGLPFRKANYAKREEKPAGVIHVRRLGKDSETVTHETYSYWNEHDLKSILRILDCDEDYLMIESVEANLKESLDWDVWGRPFSFKVA